MKVLISLNIILLALLMHSCDERNTARLAPEYLDNVQNEKVIKSIINNKKGTIALLYGNDIALQTAHDSLSKPDNGAKYTLITWKQKPMPQWYGTNMNGEIYSVEDVKVVLRNQVETAFEYNFQAGKGFEPGDIKPEKDQRIHFIVSQRAAIFP